MYSMMTKYTACYFANTNHHGDTVNIYVTMVIQYMHVTLHHHGYTASWA